MQVLLLSCNTGEGHNATARAIMEVLEADGVTCEKQDALSFLSPKFSQFVCGWHTRLYRHSPALFDVGYRAIERNSPEPEETTPLYELLALGADKLWDLLRVRDFDAVICVHVFSGLMMTEVRRKFGSKVPCFLVDTDYSYAPYSDQCDMDGFFIPEESLIPDYVASGVPRKKLLVSGIPVGQAFYSAMPRDEARKMLNLPKEGMVVLLMCGSMGCGPIPKLAREMMERIPEGSTVVTVCGRNEKLYESMAEVEDPRLRVLGFTTQIPAYMDAADLIVTKPGGLSSTEAGCKHLPMVFINAVGGCEAKNFGLFLQRGYAVGSKNVGEVVDLVTNLTYCPERLAEMRSTLEGAFCRNSARIIGDYVVEAGHRYREVTAGV